MPIPGDGARRGGVARPKPESESIVAVQLAQQINTQQNKQKSIKKKYAINQTFDTLKLKLVIFVFFIFMNGRDFS